MYQYETEEVAEATLRSIIGNSRFSHLDFSFSFKHHMDLGVCITTATAVCDDYQLVLTRSVNNAFSLKKYDLQTETNEPFFSMRSRGFDDLEKTRFKPLEEMIRGDLYVCNGFVCRARGIDYFSVSLKDYQSDNIAIDTDTIIRKTNGESSFPTKCVCGEFDLLFGEAAQKLFDI